MFPLPILKKSDYSRWIRNRRKYRH